MTWEHFAPSIVNAFYDPDTNSINVMPGYAAAYGYKGDLPEERLMGTFGWMLGHEICHGFDYCGGQKDAYGLGNSIFDEADIAAFLERVDRLVAYYNTLEPLPGITVNGEMVKTEAAADLCGLQIVLETVKNKENFSYEDFFGATADLYAMVLPSTEILQGLMGRDNHPISNHRTNVNAQMFDEFYETYGVAEGDGMYVPKEDRICFFG